MGNGGYGGWRMWVGVVLKIRWVVEGVLMLVVVVLRIRLVDGELKIRSVVLFVFLVFEVERTRRSRGSWFGKCCHSCGLRDVCDSG